MSVGGFKGATFSLRFAICAALFSVVAACRCGRPARATCDRAGSQQRFKPVAWRHHTGRKKNGAEKRAPPEPFSILAKVALAPGLNALGLVKADAGLPLSVRS